MSHHTYDWKKDCPSYRHHDIVLNFIDFYVDLLNNDIRCISYYILINTLYGSHLIEFVPRNPADKG